MTSGSFIGRHGLVRYTEQLGHRYPRTGECEIRACLRYARQGAEERAERRARLARVVDERCLLMASMHAGSTELFTAYEKWCAAEREDAGTPTAFATAMKAKGFENGKSNGRMRWRGIGLAAEDAE